LSDIIQFESVKKGVAWFCRERARRMGHARNLDMTAVRATMEEQAKSNRTYAAMIECLSRTDPRGGDDLHEALGRAAVVSVVGGGVDQQNEADRQHDVNPEKASNTVEWSKSYAGRGLAIVGKRMRERGLLKEEG
jgi:hypothetical protein